LLFTFIVVKVIHFGDGAGFHVISAHSSKNKKEATLTVGLLFYSPVSRPGRRIIRM
jgi:hypothetical protein